MAYRCLLAAQRLVTIQRSLRQLTPLSPHAILPQAASPLTRLHSTDKAGNSNETETSKPSETTQRITDLIGSDKVVVFMKGEPDRPMCGFSRAVVQILQLHGVGFSAVNVLEDEGVRAGVKEHTGWPTIPQVFFNGELIGGMDILLQMHQNQELLKELEKIGITSRLAPVAKED